MPAGRQSVKPFRRVVSFSAARLPREARQTNSRARNRRSRAAFRPARACLISRLAGAKLDDRGWPNPREAAKIGVQFGQGARRFVAVNLRSDQPTREGRCDVQSAQCVRRVEPRVSRGARPAAASGCRARPAGSCRGLGRRRSEVSRTFTACWRFWPAPSPDARNKCR